MSISQIAPYAASPELQRVDTPSAIQSPIDTAGTTPVLEQRFSAALTRAIEDTNSTLLQADREANDMVVSEGANLHETMIALEKADIALRMTVRIGQKLVQAYQEINRMQI